MSHLSAFGDLKKQAGQPGPATYNVEPEFGADTPRAGFGTAQRPDITKMGAYAEQIKKEVKERAARKGDALDELVVEVSGKPSAAAPAPAKPKMPSVIPHDAFLRQPDALAKLVNSNCFPAAAFVTSKRNSWRTTSQMDFEGQRPWRMMDARPVRTPIDRHLFHRPNFISEEIEAGQRMGIKCFGAR